MTYQQLLEQLQSLSPERLADTVTVLDPYTEEFTAIIDTDVINEEIYDQLDPDHFYLIMKA
jgi:hypothetical protein